MNIFRTGSKLSIWGLTEQLIGRSKLPEKVLVAAFQKTVKELEMVSRRRISSETRKKIFPRVTPYVIRLKAAMVSETYNRVLGHFNPRQLKMINEEMDKTGDDVNLKLRTYILLRLSKNEDEIEKKVWDKAEELSDQLMFDTMDALREEGIDIW